jgi:hypothetical protein
MKPAPLPEDAAKSEAWRGWPKLEQLHAETGLKVSELRAKLVEVPCYRCPDKSVRYEPEAARAAVFAFDDDDDQDDDAEAAGIDKELSNVENTHDVYKLLCRELLRALREERKDRGELVRSMQAPLDRGLSLIETTIGRQATRLEHLEGVWDRMLKATEDLMSAQAVREVANKQAAHSQKMKEESFGFVKEHLPTMLDRWRLTGEAALAVQFLGSLDPKIVDAVIATGVLDAEQTATLGKLRTALEARKRHAEKVHAEEQKKNSESHEPPIDTQGEEATA